jgi:hypothetical protein
MIIAILRRLVKRKIQNTPKRVKYLEKTQKTGSFHGEIDKSGRKMEDNRADRRGQKRPKSENFTK